MEMSVIYLLEVFDDNLQYFYDMYEYSGDPMWFQEALETEIKIDMYESMIGFDDETIENSYTN